MPAHRFAYEALVGRIPDGLVLDHVRMNPDWTGPPCSKACVNPEHLQPVTQKTNKLRGTSPNAQNARKTHCLRGHPLSGHNLVIVKGGRNCRACRTAANERWRARNAARTAM